MQTKLLLVLVIAGAWVLPAVAVGVWGGRTAGRGFLPAFLLSLVASPVVGAIYVASAALQSARRPGG